MPRRWFETHIPCGRAGWAEAACPPALCSPVAPQSWGLWGDEVSEISLGAELSPAPWLGGIWPCPHPPCAPKAKPGFVPDCWRGGKKLQELWVTPRCLVTHQAAPPPPNSDVMKLSSWYRLGMASLSSSK